MSHRAVSPVRRAARGAVTLGAAAVLVAIPVFAGFPSTESYLPAVGRIPGQNGAQFYTTIWATNLTGATVSFTFDFLKTNQANPSPASFSDTLAPGQTRMYENVVETMLHTTGLGAARVISSGEILLAERIYNQEPGDDLGRTDGLFFAGVPKSFSISLGQSASIQGIDQGGAENFRYNFALVETGGGSPTVHVVLYDEGGDPLGAADYVLQPYEQIQPNVDDLVGNLATTDARITATVTGGTGSVLIAGAQIANESQDSSGFEMSFRDDLLGGGASGLTAVAHDGTLLGDGTTSTPLAVNPAAIVTSVNGLHGAVTLSAGSNVTITPSGQTLTIAASGGGGGGLTLPFSGTTSSGNPGFAVTNTDTSAGIGIAGYAQGTGAGVSGNNSSTGPGGAFSSKDFAAVYAMSDTAVGVFGTTSGAADTIGVEGLVGGTASAGVYGENQGPGTGVLGLSASGNGVVGQASTAHRSGVEGEGSGSAQAGVYGLHTAGGHGVVGMSTGTGTDGAAIYANSAGTGGIALFATNAGTDSTIVATNGGSGDIYRGFSNGGATFAFEVTGAGDVKAHGSFVPNGIDYADRLPAETGLEPGDVVAIGVDGILRKTKRRSETAVAGVYSTKPGVEGRDESDRRATIPVALAGVIPVKSTTENGAIRPGDLLVSSSTPGVAMRAPGMPTPGTVIGKAMEPLASGSKKIEMLVMLR